jgi:hypothetical protein
VCYNAKELAAEAGSTYETPWDAEKQYGCICDAGFRGLDCAHMECPSGADAMKGPGNEAGRDCSGRGLCDYQTGDCACFTGYYGAACQYQLASLLQ